MKNIFSPVLVSIYYILLMISLSVFVPMFLGLTFIGGKTVPIPNDPYTSIVTEESKPLFPELQYINTTYLRDINIFFDQNIYFFLLFIYIVVPGLYLLTTVGLITTLEKTKNKAHQRMLIFLLIFSFSPVLYAILKYFIVMLFLNLYTT